jgi:hypothetical protein
MKVLKRLICFVFAFMAVMIAFCLTSFAADITYTGNVIPKMTSNTTPSGIAIASSIWDNNYSPWKAFNQSNSLAKDAWATQKDVTTGWLEYDFDNQKCISKYTLVSRVPVNKSINEIPRDWTFEGWNEQLSTWIVLDSRNGIADWQQGVKKDFEFINKKLYKKYRINITANVGFSEYTCIGEMEMMEAIEAPTNLLAIADTSKVNLSWDIVTGAETYNIKRSTTPKGPYTSIDTTSANTYTDNTVIEDSTYYYVVSAVNEGVESDNSNEVYATPTSIKIISGTFYVGHFTPGWNLNYGDGVRSYTAHVDFGKTLPKVPIVFAALQAVDTEQSINTRIRFYIGNVTANGFDITFETWNDSIVWNAGANWIAFI